MKIDKSNVGGGLKSIDSMKTGASDKKRTGNTNPLTDNSPTSSKVDLSGRAQMIQKAKELAKADSESVDEAKVARLQKLIDEKKYELNADAIAGRLVDDHLMFPE